MKKLLPLCICAMLLFLAVPALCADSGGTWGKNLTWRLEGSTMTISGTGVITDDESAPWNGGYAFSSLVIEEGVTGIGRNAFAWGHFESVSIPSSVKSIGAYAFWYSGLKSVDIPEGVTEIGEHAFSDSAALASVSIPAGVKTIDECAFCWCKSLKSVRIAEGAEVIGDGMFGTCPALVSVSLPESLRSIGMDAFSGCSSLKSISLPSGLRSISETAFWGCSALAEITIPEGVEEINWGLFLECTSLKRVVLPDSVREIKGTAFAGCTALREIQLPSGLTAVEENTFSGCAALKEMLLPDGVTAVGDKAFSGCAGLVRVRIPDTVTAIGAKAFSGCGSLTDVVVPAGVAAVGDEAFASCESLGHIAFLATDMTIGMNAVPSGTVVCCYEYTDADTWASKNGYACVYLDGPEGESARHITLDADFSLECGASRQLVYALFLVDGDVAWRSSDPAVVRVNQRGRVTALKPGTATVTATAGDVSASVRIDAYVIATDFEVSGEIWVVAKTEARLEVTMIPAGGIASLTYTSSDTSVAEVDAEGNLTAYKPRDVTITVLSDTGISHTCLVHVCYPVTAVEMTPKDACLPLHGTLRLTADVTMRTQSCVNRLVTFTSSDESVARVDGSGLVTAAGKGRAVITAVSAGGVCAGCAVTVYGPNTLTLPAGTVFIGPEAFAGLPAADVIVIPESVTEIADDAFSGTDAVISAPRGSFAESWAEAQGVPCVR